MKEMLSVIFYELCNFLEAGIYTYFLIKLFPFKINSKVNGIKIVALCFILHLIFKVGQHLEWGDLQIVIIQIIVFALFARFYLEGKIIHQCIWILIDFLMVPLINIILMQFMLLVLQSSYKVYTEEDSIYYILGMILSKVLHFGVVQLILFITKNRKLFLSSIYGLAISIILGYSLLMEGVLFYAIGNGLLESYQQEFLVISIGIVAIDICLIITMFKISEKTQQEKTLKLLQIQNEFQEQQIQELENSENRISRLRHDYKNHIINLQELLRNDKYVELEQYLISVSQYYIDNTEEFLDTGNSVLNAIINTRLTICKEVDIELLCLINGEFNKLQGFELGIILFNLLDNAIEASKCEEGKREIYLDLEIRGKYVSFLVKNGIRCSVLKVNPKLYTTKLDKQKHGLGVRHVEELIISLGGTMEVFEEDKAFCVHGMLPYVVNK